MIKDSEWNDLTLDVANLRKDTASLLSKVLLISEALIKQEKFMKQIRNHFDIEKTEPTQNDSDEGSAKTSKTEKSHHSVFKPKIQHSLKEFTDKADALPTHINQILVSYSDLRAIQYN
jgi:hypothetical protein